MRACDPISKMSRFTHDNVKKLALEMQRKRAEAPAGDLIAELDDLIARFVQLHAGKWTQRGEGWYREMGTTVGGSELAAIMEMNPYSSFSDVVMSKIASLKGSSTFSGGEACWWGVLFEDVIAACVEVDLGGKIRGDEICIQEYPGHRNSPDGYIVARFWRMPADDGSKPLWEILTTDAAPPDGAEVVPQIVLLEFKCPVSRKPSTTIPPQYKPQMWSGLMVSPIAGRGIFVDAVFRKCDLPALGDTPDYDHRYHYQDDKKRFGPKKTAAPAGDPNWEAPVAWGLIAFYAPLASAPEHVRRGWRGPARVPSDPDPDLPDADGAAAAAEIQRLYFGTSLDTAECADLGDMEPRLFGRTLGLFDRGIFRVNRAPPCFADGRGSDLRTGRGIRAQMRDFRRDAPAGFWLLGVLPWKLFEVTYVPVERRPGFDKVALPLIAAVHELVTEALSSTSVSAGTKAEDTGTSVSTSVVAAMNYVAKKGRSDRAGHSHVVGDSEVQDLFDSL
jgi:YqaJ-like viral recombinase domain